MSVNAAEMQVKATTFFVFLLIMKNAKKSTQTRFRKKYKPNGSVPGTGRLKLHKINNYLSIEQQLNLSFRDTFSTGRTTSTALYLNHLSTATFLKARGIPEKPMQVLCCINVIMVLLGINFVSTADICKFLPWNRRTVTASLKWAVDHNFLTIVKGGYRGRPGRMGKVKIPHRYFLEANGQSLLNEYYDLTCEFYRFIQSTDTAKIRFDSYGALEKFNELFT